MPRPATGSIRPRESKDGTITYVARFSFNGRRHDIPLGTAPDWTQTRANAHLRDVIMPAVRQGTWAPPTFARLDVEDDRGPTVHELATEWYYTMAGENFTRELGNRLLKGTATPAQQAQFKTGARWGAPSTALDQGTRLKHVLREVGGLYVREVRVADVLAMRKRLSAWRLHNTSDVARGVPVDDRRLSERTLTNGGIEKIVRTLQTILDWGVALEVIDLNPVRASHILTRSGSRQEAKAARANLLHNVVSFDDWEGLIATCRRLESTGDRHHQHIGRTVAFGLLWIEGMRNQEVCELHWRDVDLDRRIITVRDAKTAASIREVLILDGMVPILEEWRRNTRYPRSDQLVCPTVTGKRRARQSLNTGIVAPVVRKWNAERRELAAAAGEPPPEPLQLTPHDGRRSMCTWWAWTAKAGEGPTALMLQVGHADSRLALEVYNLTVGRNIRFDERFRALMRRPDGR